MHSRRPIAPGATFQDRYEILEEIGRGGFGTVYKAKQLATGQLVAIKVLRGPDSRRSSGGSNIARFLREMRLCARLHHPNIVRLIDSGRTSVDAAFTVFEFVPGQNLGQVLAQEGTLEPSEARHLMMEVLDALACAHAQGIVHRDLKPMNIMVTTGGRRNALVLDFGIGAITTGAKEESEELTATGEILGSPAYAAPEQFLRLRPSPRSDLFSWALVFLECLVGPPATSGEPFRRAMLRRLGEDPIVLPKALSEHGLGAILQRALVKDVSARDVTASGLMKELEACDARDLPRFAVDPRRPSPGANGPTGVSLWTPAVPETSSGVTLHLKSERQRVTALFCRVAVRPNTTSSGDSADADALMDRVQRAIAKAAGQSGEGIVMVTPDGVAVYFGYPETRDDDAQRAVEAALSIEAALCGLQWQPFGDAPSVETAIGVHTGFVLGRGSDGAASLGPIVGVALSTAVAIARFAYSAEILVCAETRRLTKASFHYRRRLTFNLEESAPSVDVFALQTARELHTTRVTSSLETPFVAREQAVRSLLELAEQMDGGPGSSVLIRGAPGIGKTRLVREVSRCLWRKRSTVLQARCTPDAVHAPLQPFVGLLERLLGLDSRSSPAAARRKIEALVQRYALGAIDPSAAIGLCRLVDVPLRRGDRGVTPTPSVWRSTTGDALLALLRRMADTCPLVLVVEDIHWADPTTRELLGGLVEKSPPRCFLMASAAADFMPSWSPSRVLTLEPLQRDAVDELVAVVTRGASLDARCFDTIASYSEGIPLLIEEISLALLGSPELEVPKTLTEAVRARWERLGSARRMAELAAVIGYEFRSDVLTMVAGGSGSEVRNGLRTLVASGLVHDCRRDGEEAFAFRHALVRDALYSMIPQPDRELIHSRIAVAMEDHFDELATRRPDVMAHHHAAAGEMVRALAYAERAATRALERSASDEALSLFEQAIGWVASLADDAKRKGAEAALTQLVTTVWRSGRPPAGGTPRAATKGVVADSSTLVSPRGAKGKGSRDPENA